MHVLLNQLSTTFKTAMHYNYIWPWKHGIGDGLSQWVKTMSMWTGCSIVSMSPIKPK